MRILERESEISTAHGRLSRAILAQPGERVSVTVGYQSGSTEAHVHYLPSEDIWVYFGQPPDEKSPGDRYWNIFGLGRPSGNVSIACEINPAKSGLNRRVGGAFAVDPLGRVWLVHRGNFNARGRIPFQYTRDNFRWNWKPTQDGNQSSEVLAIDALDSPDLVRGIGEFVNKAVRFKDSARSRRSIGKKHQAP